MTESEPWEKHAREELGPKMADTSYVITISPGDEIDPKIALETGYAVLLDKPVLVLTWPGREVPSGLRRFARRVVDLPGTPSSPEGQKALAAALESFHEELEEGEEE